MKSKRNIVFLGMMGSGKTSIGKLISNKLKWDFFDIDQIIETNIGMNISKIFDQKGEKFFRDQEEKTTLNILKKNDKIIALGGGAFLNKNIRDEILNNHISFWLNWDAKTLINRIKKSTRRPIAINSTTNELYKLIQKRSYIYSKALYKVDCEGLTKTEIVKEILKRYETKKINN
tara:strand:+ start:516 stop:1040 length:525 start_codon:yes stop_codon:yes gene_type:complete